MCFGRSRGHPQRRNTKDKKLKDEIIIEMTETNQDTK
jgi:hypothetical protein